MPGFSFRHNKKDTGTRKSRWGASRTLAGVSGDWHRARYLFCVLFFFYSLWNCFISSDHFPLFLRSPPPVLFVGYFVEHAQLESEDLACILTVERGEGVDVSCSVHWFPFQRKTDLSQFFRGFINKKITPTSYVIHCLMEIQGSFQNTMI